MTSAWTLYVLLVGTLLACAALALDGILRRTTLPTRWVWVSALAGIVCLAVIAPRSEGSRMSIRRQVVPVPEPGARVTEIRALVSMTPNIDPMWMNTARPE